MTTRSQDLTQDDVEIDLRSDDPGEPELDLDATYWSIETAVAREETAVARAELGDARRQLTFLREQLAEASAAERVATARASLLEAELAAARPMHPGAALITDASWLERSPEGHASPDRSRHTVPAPSEREIEAAGEPATDGDRVDGLEAKVEHPRPGHHADDLLPLPEKRRRRGRR